MPNIIEFTNLDDLIRRYQAGESELKLAREFSVSRNVIRKRLIDSGIIPRNGSQANIISMSLMTAEQRKARSAAAHIAVKGRYQTIAERERRATSREAKRVGMSRTETILAEMLQAKGINTIPQKAIGMYNVDLAIKKPRIAVEIMGGNWHTTKHHSILHSKRIPYILNQGWNVVIIWVDTRNYPLTINASDYIISFMQSLRFNESKRAQYRVIRGTGEDVPILSSNFNCLTPVECPTSRDKMGRFHSNIR